MYQPECVFCGKRITWTFYLCKEHEEEWGRRADERPLWLNELINDEARIRRQYEDRDDIKNGKEEYLEDEPTWGNGFYYDIEEWIIVKQAYINIVVDDSDGHFEIKDSDWLSVFSYGV